MRPLSIPLQNGWLTLGGRPNREAGLETRLELVRAHGHSNRLHPLWLGRRSRA